MSVKILRDMNFTSFDSDQNFDKRTGIMYLIIGRA